MQFAVVDRGEETKGLLKKTTLYTCTVNMDFTDIEMEILEEMCRDKAYAEEPIAVVWTGNMRQDIAERFPITFGEVSTNAKKNGGVYSRSVTMERVEEREGVVEELKDVARTIKKRLELRESMNEMGDEDTYEEL